MGPLLPKLAATLIAFALCGDGMLNEGDGTSLPVSPTGGMSTLQPENESVYGFTDAGILWAPTPEGYSVEDLHDGGSPLAAPDAGPAGPCTSIVERIAHRREWIAGVEKKANEVGLERGAQVYCELHPADPECTRPPVAVERNLDELIQNSPDDPKPEVDAWIVRWTRELTACRAQHRETPRPTARK